MLKEKARDAQRELQIVEKVLRMSETIVFCADACRNAADYIDLLLAEIERLEQ